MRRIEKSCASSKTTSGHAPRMVVRHAPRQEIAFSGDDTKRPLDKQGRAQAEALVGQLLAFGAPTCAQPTGCAVNRRWNHSPKSWVPIQDEPP